MAASSEDKRGHDDAEAFERLAEPRLAADQERNFCLTKSEIYAIGIPIGGINAPGRRLGEERRMKKGFETF